jgi:hypothetical protein
LAGVTLTTEPNEEIGGKRSLKGDSCSSTMEWNEFFHLRQGILKTKEAYKVTFDYRVLAKAENAKFYALFRREGGSDTVAWTDLTAGVGVTGHAEMAISTRGAGNYTLIIGIQNHGAMAINNLIIQTTPEQRPVEVPLPNPQRIWKSPGDREYYLDSLHGNDTDTGLSPTHAWKSLDKVNSGEFAAGDRIWLRSGSAWSGFLAPGGSGRAGKEIQIRSYGEGPRPRIDAGGKALATLYLHNVEYVYVQDLDIANTCAMRVPGLAGVRISVADFGTAHHLYLHSITIHDVSGSLVKSEGGGNGIYCDCGGSKVKSRFDDLRIVNCTLRHTDRNGITMNGYWSRAD